ncbi:hypothetical protein [Desulfotalea psychrophila]|uniref:Uncharacterized protein n=1 Tax=Desulfotalea psychrophila (strain LSv54 / DSM 12343) TaxID=177439 RepID=Q6AMS1_DESPS|nr:hypothetical protein [Desulfotalea psychrophila]CAG36354.1 hypothetical protein DP1625 [Desulfotalea psychrophila LSv54]
MLTPDQEKIIQLLLEQETLLHQLYTTFSHSPQYNKPLWQKLAKEEATQEKWLQQLTEASQQGIATFDENKITAPSLQAIQQSLKQAIRQAETGELDERRALIQAASFQRAVIENDIFSSFSDISPAAEKALEQLKKQPLGHLQQVEALYALLILSAEE